MDKKTLETIETEKTLRNDLKDHLIIFDHYANTTVTEKKYIKRLKKELSVNIKQQSKTLEIQKYKEVQK